MDRETTCNLCPYADQKLEYRHGVAQVKTICTGTKEQDECRSNGDIRYCMLEKETPEKSEKDSRKLTERAIANTNETNELKTLRREVAFYRYYIWTHDLTWDAMNEFLRWEKEKNH